MADSRSTLPAEPATPAVGFKSPSASRYYDVFAGVFVALLVVSNISATKLIALDIGPWQLIFDGGAVAFPLTYVLGDVLSEVYGWRPARRVILIGFLATFLSVAILGLVAWAPSAPAYPDGAAFAKVAGFAPRIAAASLAAYLAGQLLNAFILVRIKERFGERHLWVRLIASTVVGEAADTAIFCTVAFAGLISLADFWNYLTVGYFYKVLLEVVLLPVTYRVIAWTKRREASFGGAQ